MIHKQIIDEIDNQISEEIDSNRYCNDPKLPIKRHGLSEIKFIQSEGGELLYSYSEKQKVTIDNKYKVQLIHIQSEGRLVNNRDFGATNQGEYLIEGKLIVIAYSHSMLKYVLDAFQSMDYVGLIRFVTNSEENAKRYLKVKRDDKNYNPETRIFVFEYQATFQQ
jgi:hypothetical protein